MLIRYSWVPFALLWSSFCSICLLNTASAQTEIHKCTDADGGVSYSQLPCVSQKPAKAEKAEKAELEAKVERPPPVPVKQKLTTNEASSEDPESKAKRTACKKRYRDAIDVIDAEIGREYSSDKAAEYKQRLLVLTRNLRRC